MKAALVGLPAAGKTTVFRILSGADSAAPHHHGEDVSGVIRVDDPRLDRLTDLYHPKKTTPVAHEVLDPGAAFPDAGAREGRGEKDSYAGLRSADLLIAVVRAFTAPTVAHPAGSIDPERDRARVEEELALADLVLVDTRLERMEKLEKVGKKSEAPGERALLARLHERLGEGLPLRSAALEPDEEKRLRGYGFLSLKPLLVVHSTDEGGGPPAGAPPGRGCEVMALPAAAELEVSGLPAAEQPPFREALGLAAPGRDLLIAAIHRLLGLVTFFTAGPPEVRAWQVGPGASVVEAAGKIHSDIGRGFIRAEVLTCEQILEAGSLARARERGWLRTEGREYTVRDGDVLHVLFKV